MIRVVISTIPYCGQHGKSVESSGRLRNADWISIECKQKYVEGERAIEMRERDGMLLCTKNLSD